MREHFIFWIDIGHFVTLVLGAALFFRGRDDHWIQVFAIAVVLLTAITWGSVRFLRRSAHLLSHLHDVFPRFDLVDNRPFFVRAGRCRSYRYLGVSGQTIEQELRRAVESGAFPPGSHLRFLLIAPGAEALRECVQQELAVEPGDPRIATAVSQVSAHASTCAGTFASFANAYGLQVDVRTYDAYAGYWAHLVGEEEAAVGPFYHGRRGFDTPVLHLRGKSALLSWYQQDFERIWRSAKPWSGAEKGTAVS